MDSLCGKLLTSMFILPFAAGNYRIRRNGSWYSDCTIASRVLFLIVLAMVIMFTASKSIQPHAEFRLGTVIILLSIFMVSALIGIYILGNLVRRRGLQSVVLSRRNTRTPKLQVIFLWGFGLASVLHCSLFLGKQIECLINSTFYWSALLCFNITLIVSLCSEMTFITYFSSFKMKPTFLVNYVVLLLLTCNTLVIFYLHIMHDVLSYLIEVDPNSELASCLKINTTITILIDKFRPFLSPTFIEYSLLSSTILLEIWSSRNVHRRDIELSQTSLDHLERVPLINDLKSIEHQSSENGSRKSVCRIIALAVTLSTGLGLVICDVAEVLGVGDIENTQYVSQVYELSLKVTMIVAIFAGFFCLVQYCTPDESAKGLKSRDCVYLLSAFGLFMIHIAEGIGGDVSSDDAAKLVMFTGILSIFQDYFQVVFLLCANRCKKSDPRTKLNLLESVLIFIMISNMVLWITDSFIRSKYPGTRVLNHDNFPAELIYLVYDVLLPVTVFYRFTSFLEYYETFCEYTSFTHTSNNFIL